MTLSRLDNWPRLLADYITSKVTQPFEWGRHDCCMFAANAVHAITGDDLAWRWSGHYRSALGAARLMRKEFGKGLGSVEQFPEALGLPECETRKARRGDIVLVPVSPSSKAEHSLAVVVGATAVAASRDGLQHIPMTRWLRAWRIG